MQYMKESSAAILLRVTESLAHTGTWELDLENNSLTWSDGVFVMLGYVPQAFDVNVQSGMGVIHPDDQARALAHFQQVVEQDIEYNIQKRLCTSSGQYIHVRSRAVVIKNEAGAPVQLIGVFQDIDRFVRAEEELRRSNERFEKVVQATNDTIWDWDIVQDKLYRGGGSVSHLGMEVYDQSIDHYKSQVHPDDVEHVVQSIGKALADQTVTTWQEEYRYLHRDGGFADVVDRGIIIRDEQGRAVRMLGAMSDISYRKAYEKSLQEMNTSLEYQTRELAHSNAELEQFAYIASHDLQEPLRMITNFITLLERRYQGELDEKAHQYIHFVVDGARRMRSIIMDLLTYSRVGKHQEEIAQVPLAGVIEDVCALQRKLIEEKRARIVTTDLPTVMTFRTPLLQVLQNLINNALKYTAPNRSPVVALSATETATGYVVQVKDNGIGIEPEYHERIFVIFQRLNPQDGSGGTGMGLAIVKKIVGSWGGSIWVESKKDQGSSFFFTIPKSL